jgi:hypothetical protein
MDDSWNYPHQFSYIHGRLLALAFLNPLSVFHKVYATLEPGGYFEMQDGCSLRSIDSTVSGTTLEKLYNLIVLAAAKRGTNVDSAEKYKQMMPDVGFEDVVEQRFEWPIGTWAKGSHYKKIGAWFREDLSMGLEGFATVALTRVLGVKKEEVDELIKGAKEDIENQDIHRYQPL